jgi:hypothetical protein
MTNPNGNADILEYFEELKEPPPPRATQGINNFTGGNAIVLPRWSEKRIAKGSKKTKMSTILYMYMYMIYLQLFIFISV